MANGLIHECPLGCRGCIETQQQLLLTPDGQNVLYSRYDRVVNTPQLPREVTACVRVRNGDILPIGENTAESIIGAIAEGTFLDESKIAFEVAIYKVPPAKGIRGVATVALERLSDKVVEIARQSGAPQLTLIAEIPKGNNESLRFFLHRGYAAEDPLKYLETGLHELSRSIDL